MQSYVAESITFNFIPNENEMEKKNASKCVLKRPVRLMSPGCIWCGRRRPIVIPCVVYFIVCC